MGTTNTNIPDWKRKLTSELKHDKKKTIILSVLVVFAGIVGGRMLITQSSPSKAKASQDTALESSEDDALNTRATVIARAKADARSKTNAERKRYLTKIRHDFYRDIFKPNANYFPPATGDVKPVKSADVVNEHAEKERLRRIEIQVIRAQAQALALQSTILSSQPTAMINDRVLRVGDWINGFKVIEIHSRSCVVEKRNVKIRLGMKN